MGSKIVTGFGQFKAFLLVWSVGLVAGGHYRSNSNGTLGDTGRGWETLSMYEGFRQKSLHSGLTGKSNVLVSSNRFQPSHPIKLKKFRARMVENRENEHVQQASHDPPGFPVIMTYGPPIPTPLPRIPTQSFMDVEEMLESKDAALIGFGIGLAIGLGALGSIGSVIKFILIPILALGALIPLLLFLIVPVNIVTTAAGQPLSSRTPRMKVDSIADELEKIFYDIMKNLPDLANPLTPQKPMSNNNGVANSTKIG